MEWFPQIAYGIGPIVEGYLALADATGEREYAVFAGLVASWFLGANPARLSIYDESASSASIVDSAPALRFTRSGAGPSIPSNVRPAYPPWQEPVPATYNHDGRSCAAAHSCTGAAIAERPDTKSRNSLAALV